VCWYSHCQGICERLPLLLVASIAGDKDMNNGRSVLAGSQNNDRTRAVSNLSHESSENLSRPIYQEESRADSQPTVVRRFMRMSQEHDRIRMQVLAGRLGDHKTSIV
jgi:hypothetical protein